jgi:hypothetical protein
MRLTHRRLAELERRVARRLPDDRHERGELWSWCSIAEREQLEAELVAAPAGSDAELAALMRCEAALLTAQARREAGLPRDWWAAPRR